MSAEETEQMLWNKSCFLTRLVASSVRISEAAGEIIKGIVSDGDLKVVDKDKIGHTKDLQTEADRSAQYCIEKSLRAKFSERLRIIGEEEVTSVVPKLETDVSLEMLKMDEGVPAEMRAIREEDVLIWVDPLDGTTEFVKAQQNPALLKQVTVLIGITHRGRPVAGVVHQPFYGAGDGQSPPSGRTIWGIVGLGAFGHNAKKQPESDSAPRTAVTTASHHTTLVEQALDALKQRGLIAEVERVGGAGFKVLRCLEGATAYVFASRGCKKWDTAAPEALLMAAGGTLTDISGRPINYEQDVQRENTGGVLATAPKVAHSDFVAAIPASVKQALPEHQPPKN